MQIQALSFTASAQKRDVLDVSVTLMYMPRPGALAKILEVANQQNTCKNNRGLIEISF
jgi:hypothetical protein